MKNFSLLLFLFLFLANQSNAIQFVNKGDTKTIKFEGIEYSFGKGSNGNDGLIVNNPVSDISQAIQNCDATDTVYILGDGNTWNIFYTSDIPGTITFIGVYQNQKPVIDRNGQSNYLLINGTDRRIFKNLKFTNKIQGNFIYGEISGTNIFLENCDFDSISVVLGSPSFFYPSSTGNITIKNCKINNIKTISRFSMQGILNITNSIINNISSNNYLVYPSSVLNCSNSVLTNLSFTSSSNLTAGSGYNIYNNNSNIDSYGIYSYDTTIEYIYDFIIYDTSFAKNKGHDSDHIGFSQLNIEHRATYNNYNANTIALVLPHSVFNHDTQYLILANNSNSDAINTALYLYHYPDSYFIIPRLLYNAPMTVNRFDEVETSAINIKFKWDNIKGANATQFQITSDTNFVNIIKDITLPINTKEYDYTFTSNGTFYWRIKGIKQ